MSTGLKANADGSAAIQVGGSDAITITSGLNTTFAGTIAVTGSTTALYPLVSGTAVASTSGTSIDFTGIPSTAKRVTVMFQGVSTSGTSPIQIQIGTTSGFENTGYTGAASNLSTTVTSGSNSSGFRLQESNAAVLVMQGISQITLITSNIWSQSGMLGTSDSARTLSSGGVKTLTGTLDRVRITTVNGTDTFDAGTINILWE